MTPIIAACISFAAGYLLACARYYRLLRRQRIRATFFYHQYVRDVVKREQEVKDE